jgi:branched-chain amino acid transport system ATP-binding protein
MTSMLEVSELNVRYKGGALAVDGASLAVDRHECAVVLGANGAGKTSLVRAICGFLGHEGVQVSGSVVFAGVAARVKGPASIARSGVAYIPERDKIFRELTIRENLQIFAQRRASKDGLQEDTDYAFDLFPGLSRIPAGRPAGLLSGGEQQMLALSGALVSRPQLMLVDEPSLGLAPIVVSAVMRALGRIVAERDLALLLVDQNVRSTEKLANRVYTMVSGHLRLETGDDVHERLIREGYSRTLA